MGKTSISCTETNEMRDSSTNRSTGGAGNVVVTVNENSSITATEKSNSKNSDGNNSRSGPRWKFYLVIFGLQLAMFSYALELSIVSTALPRIGSEFDDMLITSWVATSYIVALDSVQPIWAKFSDIFGRKCIMLLVLGVFLVGSLLCGMAQSMAWLIAMRALQGIGAGGIFPMVYIIIAEIVPLDKRANYEGFIEMCYTFSTILGPFMGGTLTDHVNWRGIFFVSTPIIVASMALIAIFLDLPTEKQDFKTKLMRIDYAGTLLVSSATVLLMLSMSFVTQGYPWDSTIVIAPFVAAGVLVALLIFVEIKIATEPLLPPKLLSDRSVACVSIYIFGWGMSFTAFIYYIPTYFQIVHGDNAMWSGIRLIPLDVCSLVSAISAGLFVTYTGRYRLALLAGPIFCAIGFGLFFLFDTNTSWPQIEGSMVIAGLGMGCIVVSSPIAIQAAVSQDDIAVVSGLIAYMFMLGGGFGVAVASVLLNLSLQSRLPQVIPPEYAQHVLEFPEFIRDGLPMEHVGATIQTYNDAFRSIWYLITVFIGVSFASSLGVKQFSLRQPDEQKTAPACCSMKNENSQP